LFVGSGDVYYVLHAQWKIV